MATRKTTNSNPQLEENFKIAYEEANEEIQKALEKASEYLSKAVKISEEKGIPFNAEISFLNNQYTPQSFKQWKDLSPEFLETLDVYEDPTEQYGYGWQHSAVC